MLDKSDTRGENWLSLNRLQCKCTTEAELARIGLATCPPARLGFVVQQALSQTKIFQHKAGNRLAQCATLRQPQHRTLCKCGHASKLHGTAQSASV